MTTLTDEATRQRLRERIEAFGARIEAQHSLIQEMKSLIQECRRVATEYLQSSDTFDDESEAALADEDSRSP